MTATEDGIGTFSSVPSGSPGGQVNLSYPDRGHHLHDSRAGWQAVRKASAAAVETDSCSSSPFFFKLTKPFFSSTIKY